MTSHPESTIFHHSAWARVLMDIYGRTPDYFILENENSEISAAAPFFWIKSPLTGKRLVSLPRSEFCYPLAYHEDDLGAILAEVCAAIDGNRGAYLEIRGWGKSGIPEELGLKEYPYYLTHSVMLDGDLQDVRARMSRNGRYNLRYAEKSPVTVRTGQDENDLKEFYRLTMSTRSRLNLLPQPYRFFRSIYQHLIISGHGYLLLAELNGKIIAANMYFCFRDTVTHEFNAQDRDYFEYRPNYSLIWTAMGLACQNSYRCYNFGRTHPENQQLAAFKRNWGSEEKTLPYYYYPAIHGIGSVTKNSLKYRAYNTINKYAPDFLLKFAGELMYTHMS